MLVQQISVQVCYLKCVQSEIGEVQSAAPLPLIAQNFHSSFEACSAISSIGTVKPVLSSHSKRRPKLVFKTDYRLMQVKSIAECSKRAFCNTFDLHKATICL